MNADQIKEGCTYETDKGTALYVQQIDGQRVIYCHVGQIVRLDASVRRFASLVAKKIPNQ